MIAAFKTRLTKEDIPATLLWLAVFALLVIITWQKWGSVVVDCGRDVFVAEQILMGKRLYSDIYYVYGPLAPLMLALAFLIFGINLNTAYLLGITVTLLTLFLVYIIARELFKPAIASLITVCCIVLFCFQPGIFNYIFPYSYSALTGTFLSTLFIYLLICHLKTERQSYLYSLCIVSGMVIITKVEFATAITVMLVLYLCFLKFNKQNLPRKVLFIIIASVSIIPVIVSTILLVQSGWHNIYEYYTYTQITFSAPATKSFMLYLTGLKSLSNVLSAMPLNVFLMLASIAIACIVTTICLFNGLKSTTYYVAAIIAVAILLYLYFEMPEITRMLFTAKIHFLLFIPLLFTGIIIAYLVRWFRFKAIPEHKSMVIFILSVYTVLISLRCFLNFNFAGYAVYYAPLSVIVLFYFGLNLPVMVANKTQKHPNFAFYWYSSMITLLLLVLFNYHYLQYSMKNVLLSTEKGSIYTDQNTGIPLSKLLSYIKTHTSEGDYIAIMPEETLIYYLSNRIPPAIFYDTLPVRLPTSEMEEYFINSLKEKDVKLIAISNRSGSDYKYRYWGISYNQPVFDWIRDHYRLCNTSGGYQIQHPYTMQYGLLIYQKNCPDVIE